MQRSMDRGKPDAPKAVIHRKGQNPSMEMDQNARFCNRIGCNGRIKYSTLNTRIGISEKSKFSPKSSVSSSNGDGMGVSRSKGVFLDSKTKTSSQSEFDPSGSGHCGELEVSYPSGNLTKYCLASKNKSYGEIKPQKVVHHISNQHNRSPFSVPSSSKNSGLRTLYNTSSSSSNSSDINSISNNSSNSSSGCSSSSSSKYVTKNKNLAPESSFSRRGWKNGHFYPSASRISISGSGRSNPASGDSKSATRRPVNMNSARPRLSSYQQNGRIHSSSLSIGGPLFYGSRPSSGSSTYSFSGGTPENQSNMVPFTTGDLDFTHLMNQEQYNMDGIAEVLLAIERIEQSEELTHEQVLALETSLFLSGLNLYDHHRDMRLDIDNMSYEELLALEERMGTVSTALSEEALSECIETSIYDAGPRGAWLVESGEDGDDLKCSICQEEYMVGDEIGKVVECLHEYHLTCINQWLQLKNWCPICKAPAARK